MPHLAAPHRIALLLEDACRRLRSRVGWRHILANSAWLMAERILRLTIGVFVYAWLAQYLGPERFGVYSFALALVLLFLPLALLGLDAIVVREIVRFPDQVQEILGTCLVLKIVAGLATWGIVTLAVPLLKPGDAQARMLVIIIGAGMLFQALDAVDYAFRAQVRSRFTAVPRMAAFLLVSALKITLICRRAGLEAFAWANFTEVVLAGAGLVVAYRVGGGEFRQWRCRRRWLLQLPRDGWPFMLSGAAVAVFMRVDQLMLMRMTGERAVGIYSAAMRISELGTFIPAVFAQSTFPALLGYHATSRPLYLKKLLQCYTVMVWLALAGILVLQGFAAPLVRLLYGADYAASVVVLRIHVFTIFFVFYGIVKSNFVAAENMQRFSFLCTLAGAAVNIVGNSLLIPVFGPTGAAFTALLGMFCSAIVVPLFYRRDWVSLRLLYTAVVHPWRALAAHPSRSAADTA